MSVFYDVKEHLRFEGKESDAITGASICANVMKSQLASLAGLILVDDAKIYNLSMIADGKEYSYKGKDITPEYKTILAALCESEDVDIEVEYGFNWRAKGRYYDNVGPFEMIGLLEERDPEFSWDNVFYSAWNNSDSNDGCGTLVAYGINDGKTYSGTVPFEKVDHIPEGKWICQDTPIYASIKKDGDIDGFFAACRKFSAFCDEDDLEFSEIDDCVEFCMSNLIINSDEDIHHFIVLLEAFRNLELDEFGLMANLVDCSQKDARLMMTEENEEGEFSIKIASV